MHSIYVAATSQHVGKTTSTLGLTASLMRLGENIGYCKPVGQEFVEFGNRCVDKDALLFAQVMQFELEPEIHSPVILGPGATTQFIENSKGADDYHTSIMQAAKQLNAMHDYIVYEGTGHPGVGSVVNLSNAKVAKMVGAGVVMIVEGGIGSTIDELNRSLALFRAEDVPIIGVIINKVIPEKLEKVQYYVGKYLKDNSLPLLGVLPYDKSLSNPIMATISMAVKGRIVAFDENLDNRVEHIVPGSLVDDPKQLAEGKNLLLVVSHKRIAHAMEKILKYSQKNRLEQSLLSGIIITGDGRHEKNVDLSPESSKYINAHKIPVITTPLDTLGSMIKINAIEVKINTRTPWKAQRAIEMIQEYINLDAVLAYQNIAMH